ncbi:unnamed protein product, partial [marine sediment metagenome]
VDYTETSGTDAWSYSWTPPGEAAYTIYARGTDNLGNTSVATANITVSTELPSAYITTPARGDVIHDSGPFDIFGTASDTPEDFWGYKLQYGYGMSPTSWTNITDFLTGAPVNDGLLGTWDTTGLEEGPHTIRLIVLDNSSNISTFEVWVDVVTYPVITTNDGMDYATNQSELILEGLCADTTAEIRVNGSTNGITYWPGETTWRYDGALAAGANTFSVTAVLEGSSVESDPDTITITLDLEPPQVSRAVAWNNTTVRVTFDEPM